MSCMLMIISSYFRCYLNLYIAILFESMKNFIDKTTITNEPSVNGYLGQVGIRLIKRMFLTVDL
jgi:hypothetical protein